MLRFPLIALLTALLLCMAPTLASASPKELPMDMAGVKAALLAEQASGQEALSLQPSEKLPVAGLTRLPALLAVCEAVDTGRIALTDTVTISAAAAGIKGPTAFLSTNETMDVASLLKAAVMITAGDAIHALAEAAYGSATAAVQWINERLALLGVDAVYTELFGADIRLNARELILLGQELMQSPAFTAFSSLYYDTITHSDGRTTDLASSNKLLKQAVGCSGVATGSSQEAGYCGIFCVERNGAAWLLAIIGAPDAAARHSLAMEWIDHGFAAYSIEQPLVKGDVVVDAMPVTGATRSTIPLVAAHTLTLLVEKGGGYEAVLELPESLPAPMAAGQAVGRVCYVDGSGKELGCTALLPAEGLEQAGIWDYARQMLLAWRHG